MDQKLEQEKINSIKKLEDLEKEILLEQNKRPDVRNRLEEYEKKINYQSEKEKQGNQNLIKELKEWTQIKLAVDHLYDFINRFAEVDVEDSKGFKGTTKFQATVRLDQAKQKGEKQPDINDEILELRSRITKLKKIKKQSLYWQSLYGGELSKFDPTLLYNEIRLRKQGQSQPNAASPKKKAELTSTTGKENTDLTKKITTTITINKISTIH